MEIGIAVAERGQTIRTNLLLAVSRLVASDIRD
jgi:hypothetical protein